MHSAMQFIRYENCGDAEAVGKELERLVGEGFLSREQADLVQVSDLAAFFSTPLGTKLREGTAHLREFKFSILDQGSHYGSGLEEEQVLLQGVMDCALLEPDGITIVDFKTDRVDEHTLASVADRYRLQIQTYAEALSRIYEMPVKARKLYFFRLGRFVDV